MNNRLEILASHLSKHLNKITRGKTKKNYAFYRYRHLLNTRCRDFNIVSFVTQKAAHTLLDSLARFGPLLPKDLESKKERDLLSRWNAKLPKDYKFYQLLQNQLTLWQRYRDKTVLEFLESEDGIRWFKKRKRLNRKPLFELDEPFKASKKLAQHHENNVRRLLRKEPLLTLKNLQYLGVRNAQPIWQRFPHRLLHERRYLQKLEKNEILKSIQIKQRVSMKKDFS